MASLILNRFKSNRSIDNNELINLICIERAIDKKESYKLLVYSFLMAIFVYGFFIILNYIMDMVYSNIVNTSKVILHIAADQFYKGNILYNFIEYQYRNVLIMGALYLGIFISFFAYIISWANRILVKMGERKIFTTNKKQTIHERRKSKFKIWSRSGKEINEYKNNSLKIRLIISTPIIYYIGWIIINIVKYSLEIDYKKLDTLDGKEILYKMIDSPEDIQIISFCILTVLLIVVFKMITNIISHNIIMMENKVIVQNQNNLKSYKSNDNFIMIHNGNVHVFLGNNVEIFSDYKIVFENQANDGNQLFVNSEIERLEGIKKQVFKTMYMVERLSKMKINYFKEYKFYNINKSKRLVQIKSINKLSDRCEDQYNKLCDEISKVEKQIDLITEENSKLIQETEVLEKAFYNDLNEKRKVN